jgi:methionyl-tRNA formyltransferase
VETGFVPAVVVTSPDAPRGRGQQLAPCETKAWALANGLAVLSPDKLDAQACAALAAYGCEYAIVVAYGKLLPKTLIESFPKGVLNVHYSLLPKYRGASPVEGALLAGETETGVSIQRMVYTMRTIPIEPTETTRELRPRLIQAGAALLIDVLPGYLAGTRIGTPQDESQATVASKIDKKDGELDLAGDPRTNWNKYRAYAESPGTYFFADRGGKRMRIKIASAAFDGKAFTPLRIVPEGRNETDYSAFMK